MSAQWWWKHNRQKKLRSPSNSPSIRPENGDEEQIPSLKPEGSTNASDGKDQIKRRSRAVSASPAMKSQPFTKLSSEEANKWKQVRTPSLKPCKELQSESEREGAENRKIMSARPASGSKKGRAVSASPSIKPSARVHDCNRWGALRSPSVSPLIKPQNEQETTLSSIQLETPEPQEPSPLLKPASPKGAAASMPHMNMTSSPQRFQKPPRSTSSSTSSSPMIKPLFAHQEGEKGQNHRSPSHSLFDADRRKQSKSPGLSAEEKIMELTAQIELGGRPPSAAEVALATELLEEKKRAEELEVMLKAERTRAAEMEKRLKEREKLLEHGLGQEKVPDNKSVDVQAPETQVGNPEDEKVVHNADRANPSPEHELESGWMFWKNRPQSTEDDCSDEDEEQEENSQGLQALGCFRSVEKFWELYSKVGMPADMKPDNHCYAFREGCMPIRESFPLGGTWQIKFNENSTIPRTALAQCWEELLMAAVGEQLGQHNIVGVSLSTGLTQDLIQVWIRDPKLSTDLEESLQTLLSSLPACNDKEASTAFSVEYEGHETAAVSSSLPVNKPWLAAFRSPPKPDRGPSAKTLAVTGKGVFARLTQSLSVSSLASLSSVASVSSFVSVSPSLSSSSSHSSVSDALSLSSSKPVTPGSVKSGTNTPTVTSGPSTPTANDNAAMERKPFPSARTGRSALRSGRVGAKGSKTANR